jgi:hypothetical protein
VAAAEPASGTRVASGSPAGTGIDMALMAQCCGMPGIGAALKVGAAVSAQPVGSPGLGAAIVRILLVTPSSATVGELLSGTVVASGSAAGAVDGEALMAPL